MTEIREATLDDCGLIHALAAEAFPHTYREILSPEQTEYMMHWMLGKSWPKKVCWMAWSGTIHAGNRGTRTGWSKWLPGILSLL